jgi:uncharacterized protein (DUF58 family)
MERWLSKSRVLLGLCGVLLIAALNRRDPMVYGMFLFLAVVSFLGFVLPWLSLRSTTVHMQPGHREVTEGSSCDLNLLVERKARWPAFMVAVETEWAWASQRMVLSHTLPVVRAGRASDIGQWVRFPCRGHYELVAVRLSSGFPLGLVRAQLSLTRPQIHLHVLPKAQEMQWPLPWDITDDPIGELTTRRIGPSFELGMLRPYQYGEALGRVSWRASARAGELVIQHFQHSGSIHLRVVVEVPAKPALGNPNSAGEQAIRLAAGVCDAALAHSAQLWVYLAEHAQPLCESVAIRRALAQSLPSDSGLLRSLAQAAGETTVGEQVAVVISSNFSAQELLAPLTALAVQGAKVLVCIAQGRRATAAESAQARLLKQTLDQAGFATFMEAA